MKILLRALALRVSLLVALLAALLGGTGVRAETIVVGGSGFAMPLLEKLAAIYRQSHPNDSVQILLPPLGSGGALRALAGGKIDLALSGRPLKADEQAQAGEVTEWARTPLVLATHGGKRPAGFTSAELAQVYHGRLVRWDDGSPLRLILRSAYESDTMQLRSLSPAVDQAIAAALARKGMVIGENDLDTLALLEKTPGTLGPVTLGLLQVSGARLSLLPLDGVAPSIEAYRSGRYRLGKSIYLVTGKSPTAATQRFVSFLRSAKASQLLQSYAFIPGH